MRNVHRGGMRYVAAVGLAIGLATVALIGVASAQAAGMVVHHPTGQNDVCEYPDGTYKDCYTPAPVNLYPPSQVGVPAGGGEQPAMPTHEGGDEKK